MMCARDDYPPYPNKDAVFTQVPAPKPCPCECNRGGFCGGCGHAGCMNGINIPKPKRRAHL